MQLDTIYKGRLSLLGYWLSFLIIGLIIAPFSKPFSTIAQDFLVMRIILGLLLIISIFSICIRRLHDLNVSGWWTLVFGIPIANIFIGLYLSFWPGTNNPNQFGPRLKLKKEILTFFK